MRRLSLVSLIIGTVVSLGVGASDYASAGPLPIPPPTISGSCNGSPFDLVVYGGTPSGVAAAYTAAKQGKSTLLISADETIGGAMSNGLSATDLGLVSAYSGFTAKFFQNVYNYYLGGSTWRFEPRVAEQIFTSLLTRSGANVLLDSTLHSADVTDNLIDHIVVGNGIFVCAHTFVDASYTGDLIHASHVQNNLGLADLYNYDEAPAKNRFFRTLFSELNPAVVSDMNAAFATNPYVKTEDSIPLFPDVIQNAMPSMTYRLCVTNNPDNSVAFARPNDYEKFAPSWRFVMKAITESGIEARDSKVSSNGTIVTSLWRLAKIPNNKYDLNSGPYSLMNVPVPHEYFSNISSRAVIEGQFRKYLSAFLYFTQHDDSVPPNEQAALKGFGLCADEFTDNGNWPYELYIRQGRRMIGVSTFTTNDIFTTRTKKSSIAVAAYELDNKPGLFIFSNGSLVRDSAVMYRTPTYEIPLTALLPKGGPRNLITSVMISSSPTAFGSIRTETTFMALGEVAGLAAVVASKTGRSVANVPYTYVQQFLTQEKIIFRITKLCKLMKPGSRVKSGFNQKSCAPTVFPMNGL